MADVPSYTQAAPVDSEDLLYLARPTGSTTAEKNLKTTFALLQAAMDTALIPAGHTPVGYMAASDDILAHLAGIDAALQAVGGPINPDALVLMYSPSNYTLPGGNTTIGGGHLPGIDNALGALQTEDAAQDMRITALEGAPAQDAADTPYTPAVLTDWDGDADPGNAGPAVDQLADRVTQLESGGTGGPGSVVYGNDLEGGSTTNYDPNSLGVTVVVSDGGTAGDRDVDITFPAGKWLVELESFSVSGSDSGALASYVITGADSSISHKLPNFDGANQRPHGQVIAYKDGSGVMSIESKLLGDATQPTQYIFWKITKLP